MLRFKFLVLLTLHNVFSQKTPCPEVLTVDITDGVKDGDAIVSDGVHFNKNDYYIYNGTIFGCICNVKKSCVRKCCGPNEIMVDRTCTPRNTTMSLLIHEGTIEKHLSSNHSFVHNMFCESERMLLKPHLDPTDTFYLQANGSLFLPNFVKNQMRNPEHFCMDIFENDYFEMNGTLSAVVCLKDEIEEDSILNVHLYGMIISMPFLLATFIAYALLPDRNLHMKALMCYVLNLMLSYLLLVIIQLNETQMRPGLCLTIGYLCLFFFLVSFFWMNVICIDIWFGFSGLRGFSGSKKDAERKRFLLYCAYAWGLPILHVLIVYIIDLNVSGSNLRPGIGDGQCFLTRGYPELLYFYGPIAILITINVTLFAITAFRIRNIKKETSMLKKEDSKRHSYENDKQTFNLYLKLLFAMGVNWSMEIISWIVIWRIADAPEALWYLTDFCNAIYGVFIFFIFVFKRSIWKLLKKRYYSFIGKPHLAHSMTMTNTTRVTSYSTASSTVHENPHGGATDTSTLTSEP